MGLVTQLIQFCRVISSRVVESPSVFSLLMIFSGLIWSSIDVRFVSPSIFNVILLIQCALYIIFYQDS